MLTYENTMVIIKARKRVKRGETVKSKLFKVEVLKKDIVRYAPVWEVYTIGMLLFFFNVWERTRANFGMKLPYIMQKTAMINLVYAGLTAILLLGNAYKKRHERSLYREGRFLTHLVAGMCFCLVPNLLITVMASMLMGKFGFLAYAWLAQALLTYLLFFGVAVFTCTCVGNRLCAAAVYMMIHFFTIVVVFMVRTFYMPLLWGIDPKLHRGYGLSHLQILANSLYVKMKYEPLTREIQFLGYETADWWYLLIAAAVGAALLGISAWIYRKKNLDRTNGLLSRKPIATVFWVLVSLCVGAAMYFVAGSTDFIALVFWGVGVVIGYFAGQMLLCRKVNVWNKKVFFQFCIFAVSLALSFVITWLDPVGISRYVPKTENVAQVVVRPFAYQWDYNASDIVLSDAEDVEDITQMHRQIIQEKPASDKAIISNNLTVNIEYTLQFGQKIKRQYQIGVNSDWGKTLKGYCSAQECVLGTDADLETLLENTVKVYCRPVSGKYGVPTIRVERKDYPREEEFNVDKWNGYQSFGLLTENKFNQEPVITGLIDAIKKDCARGTMSQYAFHHYGEELSATLMFYYYDETGEMNHKTLNIHFGSTDTIAYLRNLPVKRDLAKQKAELGA